jgi:MiaB-like tRNA modifying enzyme
MKVYFETYGCAHNSADTEVMKDNTSEEITEDITQADTIIINTCAVKDKTIQNLRRRLKELKQIYPNKEVILAGCLTQAEKLNEFKEMPELKDYSLLGTNDLLSIGKLISSESPLKLINTKITNPGLPKKSPLIKTIPISTGCLDACTYCQTRLARGKLKSYPIKQITDNIKQSTQTKIFYLTSQDNGCYGFDIKTNLPKLLKQINSIETDFKLRIGMANPKHTKQIINELLDEMKNEKVFKFLHIPIQSGSNEVLNHMKRGNTIEEFKNLVKKARKVFPNITIATDIIVGYPTETKEDFNQTIEMLKEVKPDVVNRAKYSPRPKTYAATLKQISTNEMTRRSKILDEEFKKISEEKNKEWLNKECEVIVEAKKQKGTVVARNESYKPVILKGDYEIGRNLKVKITETKTFHLIGEVIN